MTLNEYQYEALKNKIYGDGDSIIYPTLGLAGEAGEVCGKVKKVLRDNAGEFTQEKGNEIIQEIGDCLWYIAAIAEDLGYDLDTVADLNIRKLSSRRERGVIGGSGDTR